MKSALSAFIGAVAIIVACSASITAQWPKYPEAGLPRDAQGNVLMDAPTPRTADGKPDFSGMWMRANSGPPRGQGRGGRQGEGGGAQGRGAAAPPRRRSGASRRQTGRSRRRRRYELRIRRRTRWRAARATDRSFPFDPKGPPVATFFEAGGNIEGGLPYTDWSREIRKQRFDVDKAKDNPDANCMPMGFLQFHQQPQPRKIIQTKQMILIEYEANYGIRHIYLDGRKLPPQGEPQPWWYGYSVGTWDGDTLVVETNNLRGAEDGPWDGWLDVNGSPYSREAKFTERIRRPKFGQLQIDTTLEDSKAYTKPWTVRIDQRYLADQELIEFVCNENQQFRRRIKID